MATTAKKKQKQEARTYTPAELAEELEMSPKVLRSRLRQMFPRSEEDHNTSWRLTEEQAEQVREHYASREEEDDEDLEEFED